MASTAWIEFDDEEVINHSRTAHLAQALNIPDLWLDPGQHEWLTSALGNPDYSSVETTPWYDSGYPASTEFAGIVALSFEGLESSTLESTPIEYVTDGGHSGKARYTTLSLVANVLIVASTERGAEFGKRWLDQRLRGGTARATCSGSTLRYFRYEGEDAPRAHRRDVRLTRGTTVSRKTTGPCSTVWMATFTMTAADPFEYGEPETQFFNLGGSVGGGAVMSSGTLTLTEASCPRYDYSPIFDPRYPAMVEPPTAPSIIPSGWTIKPGMGFERKWVRIEPVEPSLSDFVPVLNLIAAQETRMTRVSIWPFNAANDVKCGPLFSVVLSYLPSDLRIYVDGEAKAVYAWDGFSAAVRRTDSLAFSPDGRPVEWDSFKSGNGLLVTLDSFAKTGGGYEGGGTVRVGLDLISRSA